MQKLVLVIYLLFAFNLSKAQIDIISSIKPDHVNLQFAGNIGMASAGIGYSLFDNKLKTELYYGLTPASYGGSEIHTIAHKNTLKIIKHPLGSKLTLTHGLGYSFNYAITDNTHVLLPDHYPGGYYAPNAFHLAPFFSHSFNYTNYNRRYVKEYNIYFEIGTLDLYLWYYAKTRAMRFTDLWNLAIGTSIPLNKNKQKLKPASFTAYQEDLF